jgi:hypothetical protein
MTRTFFFIALVLTFVTNVFAGTEVACKNQTYKITVKSACPLPHGIDSIMVNPHHRTNTSSVIVEKNGKVVFSKKVNCFGVLNDGTAFFFTWFMDGASYDESSFVFTATTYEFDIMDREYNQIEIEKLESNAPQELRNNGKIQLRHEVDARTSDTICTGFED